MAKNSSRNSEGMQQKGLDTTPVGYFSARGTGEKDFLDMVNAHQVDNRKHDQERRLKVTNAVEVCGVVVYSQY